MLNTNFGLAVGTVSERGSGSGAVPRCTPMRCSEITTHLVGYIITSNAKVMSSAHILTTSSTLSPVGHRVQFFFLCRIAALSGQDSVQRSVYR